MRSQMIVNREWLGRQLRKKGTFKTKMEEISDANVSRLLSMREYYVRIWVGNVNRTSVQLQFLHSSWGTIT